MFDSLSEEDVAAGTTRIIAPVGFLDAAVSENVLAGNVMTRRAVNQYGSLLPIDAEGRVGIGLGFTISTGTITPIPPTDEITETCQKMVIDGLTFEFLLAPDTGAPSETHHWPVWGTERVAEMIRKGRDAYRFINDSPGPPGHVGFLVQHRGALTRVRRGRGASPRGGRLD